MNPSTLIGKWKVIGCQLDAIWLPNVIFQHFIYSFPDAEHFKLEWGDLTFSKYMGGFPKSDKGKILLDQENSFKTIDLIPSSGPFKGQSFKGIYHLDYDILKANFAFPGHERAKEFYAKEGQVYEIWQRI